MISGQAENIFDPFGLERSADQFSAGKPCHAFASLMVLAKPAIDPWDGQIENHEVESGKRGAARLCGRE
jgi:hypothetical protein